MDDVPTLQRNTHLGKRRVSEVNGLDPLSPMDGTLALDFLEDDDEGVDDSGEEDEVVTKKQRRK